MACVRRERSSRCACFKNPLDHGIGCATNLILSPVAYLSEENTHAELKSVIENIRANEAFIASLTRGEIIGAVFNMLLSGVVCLKHEGFHEEREWRIIYSPKRAASPHLEFSVEVVNGVPQPVYKIPLEPSTVDENDIALTRLFDRLIIGPSSYPLPMYEAFRTALKEAGVEDADKRVFISNIPIRT